MQTQTCMLHVVHSECKVVHPDYHIEFQIPSITYQEGIQNTRIQKIIKNNKIYIYTKHNIMLGKKTNTNIICLVSKNAE